MNKNILTKLLIFILFPSIIISQNIEWATKLKYKSVENNSDWNYPELMLGPPSIYPEHDYEAKLFDLYADGYVMYNNQNKNEEVELEFIKPMSVNQIVIGGIFNESVIKKVHIILRDKKSKEIYTSTSPTKTLKYFAQNIYFSLETVYGVKIIFDHTKINNWNIIKGIGIIKSDKAYLIEPNLYDKAAFPFPKDTIGHDINTHECFEFNPRLSSDGSKIYFVKECKDSDQDIWYSNLDSTGKWKQAQSIGNPLNNSGHNFVASVSLDGKKLYIGNTYLPDGQTKGMGLSVSKWLPNKTWSKPENLELPAIKDKSENANYFMNYTNDAVLIATEDENSQGDLDIYVSLLNKNTNKWGELINLGTTVNTSFNEDFPYLALDGKTMYFSSKGHIGYGGHDVYMTQRLDNSWTKWSKPVNLGSVINTKTDDNGFMIANSGEEAYFNTVVFDSIHNMDIYKIKLPKILRQESQVLIKGNVKNIRNGKAVKSIIRYKEKGKRNYETPEIESDEDGTFSFVLPHGKEYDLVIEGSRFYKINDQISLLDSNVKTKILKKYKIEPFLDSGQVSVMGNIHFEYGTSNLKDSSLHVLDKLAKQMIEQTKAIFEVGGHTDDVGSDEYNLVLSEKRAQTITNYLEKKGVRPWKLKPKGYGETVPIASNATPEGRHENRRVEVMILKHLKDYKRPKEDNIRFKYSKHTLSLLYNKSKD